MNDLERLEKIREELEYVECPYAKVKRENVLEKLILSVNKESGNLSFPIIVPIYEHDVEFLKEILQNLGYCPEYEKEFNHFWDTTCYTVKL